MGKKEALLQQITETTEQTENLDQWIKTKFLPYLKTVGAQKNGTQANYLQSLQKILVEHPDLNITELHQLPKEELENQTQTIAQNIQASKYRKTPGENGKRRKLQQWTTWKRILETQNIKTGSHHPWMPSNIKWTENKEEINKRVSTTPEDLPTPQQMKNYIYTLGYVSGEDTQLRNQSLALLLWDKGPRIGEALNIKMKDIDINGEQLRIHITGNKGSEDRTVEVFQGRKTLKDYIQKHPAKNQEEAYLFAKLRHHKYFEKLGPRKLREKIHQARSHSELDFKTSGEPFHVFRKAMITSHIVNEWATWEQVCTWHGKNTDATKPDYLLMALSDVDASVAEKMGVDDDVERQRDSRMLGPALLPRTCPGCGVENRCFHEICEKCGVELPDSSLPKNQDLRGSDEEERGVVDVGLSARIGAELAEHPDKTLNQIKKELIDDGGD